MAHVAGAPPRIAFGAQEAFQRPSGIGRYQTALVQQLAGRIDLNLFVHRPFADIARAPGAPPALSKVRVHYPTSPEALRHNALAIAGRVLAHPHLISLRPSVFKALVSHWVAEGVYADRGRFDLLHGTASYLPLTRRVKARVVTVHDTTPITMPERHARVTVRGFLKQRDLQA